MHCNDKAKDLMDIGSKELQVKQQLDSCVAKCVDGHMHLIPTMTRKMKESLVNNRKTDCLSVTMVPKAGYLKERMED